MITNKYNLPIAVYNAIIDDDYNKGPSDFTASQLTKPTRIVVLEERHRDEIGEDVTDLLYRLYGKIAHKVCEKAESNEIKEIRYYGDFVGYTVSAQVDNLELTNGVLSDYKFSTWYKFKYDADPDPNWIFQLNIQLELLRKNGLDANTIQIVGLIRDWSETKARLKPGEPFYIKNYPQLPIETVKLPIMERKVIQRLVRQKIKSIIDGRENLPNCTDEDRWVNKKGEPLRCTTYCGVAKFCTQFQESDWKKIQN